MWGPFALHPWQHLAFSQFPIWFISSLLLQIYFFFLFYPLIPICRDWYFLKTQFLALKKIMFSISCFFLGNFLTSSFQIFKSFFGCIHHWNYSMCLIFYFYSHVFIGYISTRFLLYDFLFSFHNAQNFHYILKYIYCAYSDFLVCQSFCFRWSMFLTLLSFVKVAVPLRCPGLQARAPLGKSRGCPRLCLTHWAWGQGRGWAPQQYLVLSQHHSACRPTGAGAQQSLF